MQGDATGASGGSDTGLGSVIPGESLLGGFLGGLGGGAISGGGGRGRMAARGIAQAAQVQARRAALAQAAFERLQIATMNAAQQQQQSGLPSQVLNITPTSKVLTGLLQTAAQIRAQLLAARDLRQRKRLMLEQAAVQKKIAHQTANVLPEYVPVAMYGIVNGGPLRGSRDDPGGTLDVRSFAYANYGRL